MQIAPHLHRIGSDHLAAYLVDLPGGITVIDAGFSGFWKLLEQELAAMGRRLTDIRGVIITHGDSDHLGFADRLRQEQGVPVYASAADAERIRSGKKPSTPGGKAKPGQMVRFIAYAMRHGAFKATHVQQVVEVTNGQVLPLPGSPVVIAAPGHTPGSIAVSVPELGALFVGDAVTTKHQLSGEERVQMGAFTEDLVTARATLEKLAAVGASWVLPGHGVPWHAAPEEIARTLRAAAV